MIGINPPERSGEATSREGTAADRKDPKLEKLLAGMRRAAGPGARPQTGGGETPREAVEGSERRPALPLPFSGRFSRRRIV
jgi:hypothetical protein